MLSEDGYGSGVGVQIYLDSRWFVESAGDVKFTDARKRRPDDSVM